MRQQLFGDGDPLGQTLRVNRMSCEVVGVLEAKGTTGFGQDQDATVLIPFFPLFSGASPADRDIGSIYVSARDGVATERVAAQIEDIMRQTRPHRFRSGRQFRRARHDADRRHHGHAPPA